MNITLEIPEDLVTFMNDELGLKNVKLREIYQNYVNQKIGYRCKSEILVAEFKYWLSTEPDYKTLIDTE